MQYIIDGGNLPVLKVRLEAGEQIQCEAGAMSWMDEGIEMQTTAGGLGKMLGRMLTNENAFMNTYIANYGGEIAFSSRFPGSIRAVEITPGNGLIIQKGAYLASAGNLTNEVFFQKRLSTGFFGGEGFLMRKFSGTGMVFLEIDGSAHEYDIPAGSCKIIDTGYLAAMSESCTMEVRSVKGIKNMLFGGEGFFNTAVKGPGRIILQSMPISSTAMVLYQFMPHSR
ncbi:MAG: TIGR00266 family protein [Lentisphaeria bacterium]|nr:TIGR00266 family protein [Lentisphaeria bacterium]